MEQELINFGKNQEFWKCILTPDTEFGLKVQKLKTIKAESASKIS